MLTIGILQGWRIRVLGLLMAAFENSGRRLGPGRLAKRTKRLKLDERPDKLRWAPVLFEPQAVSVGLGRQAPKRSGGRTIIEGQAEPVHKTRTAKSAGVRPISQPQ
jgi:hypothetical protein